MAKGDQNDFYTRLRVLLPPAWFAEESTILNGPLSACAAALSWCYTLYLYAKTQIRISSASDGWLDMAAYDFFGNSLTRPVDMTDDVFRTVIKRALLRERGTRQAIHDVLAELTGNSPTIFEPQRVQDTGAYSRPTMGYGAAGGYGSSLLPYQAFVTVQRSKKAGIPWVAGYRTSTAAYGQSSQGEYVSREMVAGSITDAQIYAAIEAVKMEGTLVWVRLQ